MNKEENISNFLEKNKDPLTEREFLVEEDYFSNLKSVINLKILSEGKEEFEVPEGYFNASSVIKKTSGWNRFLYLMTSSAAVLLIAFFVFSSKDVECKSFDCLLEEMELNQEDLEYFETYEEISLFDYED